MQKKDYDEVDEIFEDRRKELQAERKLNHWGLQDVDDFIAKNLAQGIHYTEARGKLVLLQPGAQKIACYLGLSPMFLDDPPPPLCAEDASMPLYIARKRCRLMYRNTDTVAGEGVGVFTSIDSPALRVSKKMSQAERVQSINRVEKMSQAERVQSINRVEKMACKRAFVHAVLNVSGASSRFTQDLEDDIHTDRQEATPRPPAARQSPTRPVHLIHGEPEPREADLRMFAETIRGIAKRLPHDKEIACIARVEENLEAGSMEGLKKIYAYAQKIIAEMGAKSDVDDN